MKSLIVILTLIMSTAAKADCNPTQYGCSDFPSQDKKTQPTIFLSCSGVTYDNKHAVHLTVTKLAPNKFLAKAHASNGEKISIAMRHGFGELVADDPKQSNEFRISLDHGNVVMLMWSIQLLGHQYMHQPMTCAHIWAN